MVSDEVLDRFDEIHEKLDALDSAIRTATDYPEFVRAYFDELRDNQAYTIEARKRRGESG